MPTDINAASTGGNDLLFASELQGVVFSPLEPSVYDAEEVRERRDDDDNPEYGRWIPAATEGHGTAWVAAPGELIEELQAHDGPVTESSFTVTRCEKSGSAQNDPYEVNITASDPGEWAEVRPEGYWESFS